MWFKLLKSSVSSFVLFFSLLQLYDQSLLQGFSVICWRLIFINEDLGWGEYTGTRVLLLLGFLNYRARQHMYECSLMDTHISSYLCIYMYFRKCWSSNWYQRLKPKMRTFTLAFYFFFKFLDNEKCYSMKMCF